MSHLHERKEKICLNCGAILTDRYCQHCGQENIEPKESFWHLLGHFLADLTHFDGKFFVTIKYLLFRPGFLTAEYVKGKRVSYLNPIRMYLFISALYFLLLMGLFTYSGNHLIRMSQPKMDSTTKTIQLNKDIQTTRKILDSLDTPGKAISKEFEPTTIAQYDSLQKALPAGKRDGSFEKAIARKMIKLKEKGKTDGKEQILRELIEKFAHTLPYLLFISVPLIALLFQLIYIRHKEYFYVSHIIFTIHYYCLYFLTLIITDSLDTIGGSVHSFSLLISFISIAYLYIAMLNFYKQGWFKTLMKYFFILIFGFMIVGLLFGADLIFSVWTMV